MRKLQLWKLVKPACGLVCAARVRLLCRGDPDVHVSVSTGNLTCNKKNHPELQA